MTPAEPSTSDHQRLRIRFHGRIIDHLGIQMYQSPVAAIAELVANAWDADANEVKISLPTQEGGAGTVTIQDDGVGMTFAECEERYLNVGYNRREKDKEKGGKTDGGRPVLGRKGIGKFAGFGIAEVIEVSTISKQTGEKTVFELDVDKLRSDGYVAAGGFIDVKEYHEPDQSRTGEHGTTITLKKLTLARRPPTDQFRRSMARRFLLLQRAEGFRVLVNNQEIPADEDLAQVEYTFPKDYREDERPAALEVEDDWGIELLKNGRKVRWRVYFFKDTIGEEELRGISIISKIKLAQRPFFFNLAGGLGGQHGQAYMTGQVLADYIDELSEDIIATERQRINWEHPEAVPLEEWGQELVKKLLNIWRDRRGEERRRQIEEKVASFAGRLERLERHERRTVESALKRIGAVPTLSDAQFNELGNALLTAWEQGRLRNLIDEIANIRDFSTETFLDVLVEADVLVALNVAEVIRTKLEALRGLRLLVKSGQLETAVRDYIAEKPYLLHPRWETFKKEVSLKHILNDAASEAGLNNGDPVAERKRVDLALRSNEHLLVVEFMRPGVTADWDHIFRVRRYIQIIRDKVEAQTGLGISTVTGLFVADKLDRRAGMARELVDLRKSDIFAFDWETLLAESEATWREFLDIIGERAPNDERVKKLVGSGHEN